MGKLIDADMINREINECEIPNSFIDADHSADYAVGYKSGYNNALWHLRAFVSQQKSEGEKERIDAKRAIEVMTTEMKCILRSDTCNHDCKSCILVLPDDMLLNAYCVAIQALTRMLKEEGEENRKE